MIASAATGPLLDLPLRGEWHATNSPANGASGHGTDFFGQRHAIDFVQMDATSTWYYPRGARDLLRHLTMGLPASAFYCWGQPVYAAAPGRVVQALDGWPDRARVQLPWEIVRATLIPPRGFSRDDIRPLAGNCVIVEGTDGVSVYAHLIRGSVRVAAGQLVTTGDTLGQVGNSGNSTMPHLHFHVMDDADPFRASGLPFRFRRFEAWGGSNWTEVVNDIPRDGQRIRA